MSELQTSNIEWCIDNCAGYVYSDSAREELNILQGASYLLEKSNAEADALRARVAELEDENKWMYGALWEASQAGVSAATRCKLELKRIARKDAGVIQVPPKPAKPAPTHHIGTPALSPYAARQIAKSEQEKGRTK